MLVLVALNVVPALAQQASSGLAAGGDVNSAINFGLTPEQLRQAVDAATAGATGPLLARISAMSLQLGVTEDAAKALLRMVGEQPDVRTSG